MASAYLKVITTSPYKEWRVYGGNRSDVRYEFDRYLKMTDEELLSSFYGMTNEMLDTLVFEHKGVSCYFINEKVNEYRYDNRVLRRLKFNATLIYVVECSYDEYSYWHVDRLFTNKDDAEKYVKIQERNDDYYSCWYVNESFLYDEL